jgi:hypothetical protein
MTGRPRYEISQRLRTWSLFIVGYITIAAGFLIAAKGHWPGAALVVTGFAVELYLQNPEAVRRMRLWTGWFDFGRRNVEPEGSGELSEGETPSPQLDNGKMVQSAEVVQFPVVKGITAVQPVAVCPRCRRGAAPTSTVSAWLCEVCGLTFKPRDEREYASA